MRKTYVLDTSVLVHDPHSLKNFHRSNVVLPIYVLDELDKLKTQINQTGKNARVCIKQIDRICEEGDIHLGVEIENDIILKVDTSVVDPKSFGDQNYIDNKILACAAKLQKENADVIVTLVSRDINLRIRARSFGINAEHYDNENVKSQDLFVGHRSVYNEELAEKLLLDGVLDTVYDETKDIFPNEFVLFYDNNGEEVISIGRKIRNKIVKLKSHKPWKLEPKNREQAMALDLLMDNSVPLVSLAGQAGSGKAQPLDSKILTPTGWKLMGDIKVGDNVIAKSGKKQKVTGVFPQGEKDIFEVVFSDGSKTQCCEDHLWLTKTSKERDTNKPGKVRSLKEIKESLRYGVCNKKNHSIPMTNPVEFNEQDLPIDPYLLGVLLGDGSFASSSISFTTFDDEILENCKKLLPETVSFKLKKEFGNYYITNKKGQKNPLKEKLKEISAWGHLSFEKQIPEIYKFNSVDNRVAILQGLMDTDGFCSKNGMSVVFYSTSKQLALDVQFLVQSLGGKAVITDKQTSYTYKGIKKLGRPSFAVHISLINILPFRLKRKLQNFKERTKYPPMRYIDEINYIGKKQAQCIMVDSEDHLYVTDDFIVTHNTLICMAAALELVKEQKRYKKCMIVRPQTILGAEIGFLPGDLQEKLSPSYQAIMDSFDFLLESKSGMLDMWMQKEIIVFEPMTYLRGRSIHDTLIICDEVQNISPHEIKAILTRAGKGTKIVLTGDYTQIDSKGLDATHNALSYVIEKFKKSNLAGSLILTKCERSLLAEEAVNLLG